MTCIDTVLIAKEQHRTGIMIIQTILWKWQHCKQFMITINENNHNHNNHNNHNKSNIDNKSSNKYKTMICTLLIIIHRKKL